MHDRDDVERAHDSGGQAGTRPQTASEINRDLKAAREMTVGEVLAGLIDASEQRVYALKHLRDSLPRFYLDQPGSRMMGIVR